MNVPRRLLNLWLGGYATPPDDVFLRVVDLQCVWLESFERECHRLRLQRNAWIVDEQLAVQVQAGRPQVGQ